VCVPRALAQRLSAVAPSATLAMSARAAEMKSRGIDVFNFGVGEPDFEPPRHVLEAAHRAIDRGASKYTVVPGIAPLREAIAETARARLWTADEVCVSIGAKHALFNLALALFEPGDQVIIPSPYWVSYPEQVRLVGASPVIVETTEASGFRMSAEQLDRALSPKTKALILCTPSNPTGAAYGEADLKSLLDVLRKHDCWIIVDEIYAELVYDGFKHVTAGAIAPDLRDRIVIVDGVSKTYAMTGWRIGWTLAPKALVKALGTIQGQSTTNATAVAQHAALAAITGPRDEVIAMQMSFEKRRDVMVGGLDKTPGMTCRKPEGAFYAFADCRGLYGIEHEGNRITTDEGVAMWLLDAAHVVGVPGEPFGAPGYIRLSYATGEDRIRAGLDAMRAAIGAARRV
jgi:aspartate aminotransferase